MCSYPTAVKSSASPPAFAAVVQETQPFRQFPAGLRPRRRAATSAEDALLAQHFPDAVMRRDPASRLPAETARSASACAHGRFQPVLDPLVQSLFVDQPNLVALCLDSVSELEKRRALFMYSERQTVELTLAGNIHRCCPRRPTCLALKQPLPAHPGPLLANQRCETCFYKQPPL